MYNNNTKILITGGAGFIGTNLINDLLNRGHNPSCIAVIDNLSHGTYLPNVHDKITEHGNFHRVDIRNQYVEKIIAEFKPEYIYHFAGLVSIYDCNNDPYEAVDNNIAGSINIMNAAVDNDVKRVIFSETSAVYEGCELPETGFEESQSDPTTIYSTTKACLALLAESYARTKGLKYTALRYFNVAGPLQDYQRTVPPVFAGFIIRMMGGNNPIIFGDPNKARDYIDVNDVNDFHILCMNDDRTENQTYNLGRGESIDLLTLKSVIAEEMGLVEPDHDQYEAIAGEATVIFANSDKAKGLGWRPSRSIRETIRTTIYYLEEEIKAGNIDPKTYMTDLSLDEVKI